MNTVFLSYSSRDYFFAEMLSLKLSEAKFRLWRDQGSVRAGDDWRQSIETGIFESFAVIVALSEHSAESPYVAYEWAYALGLGRPVIPVKLSECKVHPRLEPTQHIDFSYPRALPWEALIERLSEVDVESESGPKKAKASARAPKQTETLDTTVNEILGYLNSHGFTMASYERLRKRLQSSPTDAEFDAIIAAYPSVFRKARIKGGLPGIAKKTR